MRLPYLVIVTGLVFSGPALAQQSQQEMMKNMPAGSKDMMGAMHKMNQRMGSQQMTGDTDRDFATMMRMHHQGAIDMAKAELDNGKDSELKKMAKKVIEDQTAEIKELDRWLERHPPQNAAR